MTCQGVCLRTLGVFRDICQREIRQNLDGSAFHEPGSSRVRGGVLDVDHFTIGENATEVDVGTRESRTATACRCVLSAVERLRVLVLDQVRWLCWRNLYPEVTQIRR